MQFNLHEIVQCRSASAPQRRPTIIVSVRGTFSYFCVRMLINLLEAVWATTTSECDRPSERLRLIASAFNQSMLAAIELVLRATEDDYSGLSKRVDDVLGRAAVTVGTATDEYLDREPHRSHHQNLFDSEVANGQRRLKEVATMTGHLKFMKAALLSRFPDLKRDDSNQLPTQGKRSPIVRACPGCRHYGSGSPTG